MCLGIPMRIEAIDGFIARCSAKGIEREANLIMMEGESLAVGDYVVINLGYVIQKIDAEQAASAWEIYDQILAAETASVA